MLAPLENRALLEREPDDAANERIAELESTNAALETRCENFRARIAELESGQAIIELGRQLMELKDANEHLIVAAQRVWHLDKTICAAHRECERLASERDNLALRLSCQAAKLIS